MALHTAAENLKIDCTEVIPNGASKAGNYGAVASNIVSHYDVTAKGTAGRIYQKFLTFVTTIVPVVSNFLASAKIGDRVKAFFFDSAKSTSAAYDSDDFIYTRNGFVNLCGAAHEVDDPGTGAAIPINASASIAITTGATGQTNTLAAPTFPGQILSLTHKTDGGGNRVVTAAAAINATGNNTLTFADAGDTIVLYGVRLGSALVWRVMCNDGVALSTVN